MSNFIQVAILMFINFIEMILVSLISFFIAFKIKNNEKIENPITAVKKTIEKNRQEENEKKESKKIATMLENINNYDGSSRGQKDIK